MKKLLRPVLCLLLCALFLALPLTVARADLIYEPEDEFYRRHRDECVYANAPYEVLAPNGAANLYKSPESKEVLSTIDNGNRLNISYIYAPEDGPRWGSTTIKNAKNEWVDVWVPMDYLWRAYDSDLFYEDYSAELYEGEAVLDFDTLSGSAIFYDYPGSTVIAREMSKDWVDGTVTLTQLFQDEAGTWGYLPYYYGKVDGWVCVDNPSATPEELYPNGIPIRDTRIKQATTEEITPAEKSLLPIAAALVAGVTVLSAALLFFLKKRNS